MAASSVLLLRRCGLGAFPALRRSLAAAPISSPPPPFLPRKPLTSASPLSPPLCSTWNPTLCPQSRRRFSSAAASEEGAVLAPALQDYKFAYEELKPRELGIDEIEGCDFNHWLIVIDFPKDPRPSPEEMVRFYEETCAKALNLSLEEAKKKIYACSTSNYTGFHVEVTEIESEKFNGQPGVVFVLPDSYVDKEKKEYGGDKYINGVIIPRARPTLNGKRIRDEQKQDKQGGPRPDRQGSPSYSQEGPMQEGQRPKQQVQSHYRHEGPTQGGPIPNQRSNPPYSPQGLTQGTGRDHGATQSYLPQKNYGFPGQGERRDPQNYPFQQDYGPPAQGERRHPPNFSFQQNYGPPGQGERRETMPTIAPGSRSPYQQGNGGFVPYQGNYNQGGSGNFYPQEYREFQQGYQMNYAPPGPQGAFMDNYHNYGPGQGTPYGQGFGGYQGHGVPEVYWQGANVRAIGHGYHGPIQGPGFSQVDPKNVQGPSFHPQEQREFTQGYHRNYAPPARYHGREDYRYRGPAHIEPYGQGTAAVGYQCQRAPEAYWQGANYGSAGQGYPGTIQSQVQPEPQGNPGIIQSQGVTAGGYQHQRAPEAYWQGANHGAAGHIQSQGHPGPQAFLQAMPRNMQAGNFHPQGQNEFSHVGQRNNAPLVYEAAGIRHDYRNYGPPQGTPYGQVDDGYQVQGPPAAYWRGPKF